MTGRYIYDLPIRKSSTHLWDLKEHIMNILNANNLKWFRVQVSWGVKKVRKIVSVLVRSSTCKWLEFFHPYIYLQSFHLVPVLLQTCILLKILKMVWCEFLHQLQNFSLISTTNCRPFPFDDLKCELRTTWRRSKEDS